MFTIGGIEMKLTKAQTRKDPWSNAYYAVIDPSTIRNKQQ